MSGPAYRAGKPPIRITSRSQSSLATSRAPDQPDRAQSAQNPPVRKPIRPVPASSGSDLFALIDQSSSQPGTRPVTGSRFEPLQSLRTPFSLPSVLILVNTFMQN
jgi:hypothetical protein